MTSSICTAVRIKDFLDDMAIISAGHALYLESDVIRWITPSGQSHRFGGYVAQVCEDGRWEWWTYGGNPGPTVATNRRARSLDASRFSAHQRLQIAGALVEMREFLRHAEEVTAATTEGVR